MRLKSEGLLLVAWAAFLTISSQAQSAPAPSLTEEQILDKNIEVLGGRTALENVKSVVKRGLRNSKGGSMTMNLNGRPVTGTTEKGQDN